MVEAALTFFITAAAALVLTGWVKSAARRWAVVDHPDGRRKLHPAPVPLWGGVAVYLAMVLGLAVARLGSFGTGEAFDELAAAVVATAGIVCFFGCVDDVCRLSARFKLLLQFCAVLPVVIVGYSVHSITAFGVTVDLGWLGPPLTALWLVGCINALNLLDGMDGLASLVGIFTALMMGVIASYMGNDYVAVIAAVLAGALTGFVVHNLPPARIFLGDSGSMVIGLVVGILGIQSTLKTSATLSITAPLVVMTFPMFDTMLAIVRRKLTGRRFDVADRQHIHHRLLDRGMHPWLVLAIIGALCLATGVAATVATIVRSDALAWATALVLMVLVVRLRLFGHHELSLVSGTLARGLSALSARLASAAPGLPAAAELDALPPAAVWEMLAERTRPWHVAQLQLIVSADGRSCRRQLCVDSAGRHEGERSWSMSVRVRRGEGRSCELRAAGLDLAAAELSPARLMTVLALFGDYFANHPENVAELAEPDRPASPGRKPAIPGTSGAERRAA
jgi:UDP-GlcNAc:undecaprenyl-phosphate GlcNAc-1-phosphate transferase